MIARRRKRPFNQGHIKQIYELFFQPLVRLYRPSHQSISEFLEELFDVYYRYINRYKVKKAFNITGQLYVGGWVKVQGIGYRQVKKGDILWVREDLREPDNVDIEIMSGHGQPDQVFYVSRSNWEAIKLSIIPLDLEGEIH